MAGLASRLAVAAAVAWTAAACTGGGAPEPAPTPAPGASPTEVAIPDSPVGEQISWLLDQLAAASGPDPAEVEARFAEVFWAGLEPEEFVTTVFDGQLRPLGPWTATGVVGDTHWAEVTLRTGAGEPWVMTIVLDSDQLIESLFFAPDPAADRTPAASLDALQAELAELAEQVGFLAARVDDQACTPVAALAPDTALPVGSTFKLYVLGALADAAAAGEVDWDETVTVTDELRSLPSGRLQDKPAGTQVPVREAAEAMIAISDNTATDLLIDRLGRERVEGAVAAMGHADPASNTPLLTTREYFLVGWSDPDWRQRWAAGNHDTRNALLAELATAPLAVTPAEVTDPVWPDGVDWFAAPADLCAAHLELQQHAATSAGAPVRDLLAVNPGVPFDTATWPYVAYKGGSAPGVVTGSWYAEHTDGSAVVVVFQLAASTPIDLRLAFAVAADAFPLLATELGS